MKSYMQMIATVAFTFLAQSVLASEAPTQPACTKEDQTHLRSDNHRFADSLYDCSGISGLDTKCFNDAYRGISEGCLGCYKRLTRCTINNCTGKCMWDPKGKACRECSKDNCGKKHEACIGLGWEHSPDFERSHEG